MLRRPPSRVISSEKQKNDERNFQHRPKTFAGFIGHENQVERLRIAIEAAKTTGRLKHILLTGDPGNGKTTLAEIIANESGKRFIWTNGPELRQPADLAKILIQVREGDILFIDEVHRVEQIVQETLYSVMDDFKYKYNGTEFQLSPFTMIGATTKQGNLAMPFNSRFHTFVKLQEYNENAIKKIMLMAAEKRNLELTDDAVDLLARCARRNPRVAVRLIDNSIDVAIVCGDGNTIDFTVAKKMLDVNEIDENGLDPEDRNYLIYQASQYPNPTGLNTIALFLSVDKEYRSTVEYIIEPWLIHLSLIRKTNKGRILTSKALNDEKLGLGTIVIKNHGFIPPPRDGGRESRYRGGNGSVIDNMDDIELTLDSIDKKRNRRGW